MEGLLLLVVGAILLASLLGAFAAGRTGLPLLVVFLGLGMLLGSEGPGGIPFDDPELARTIGVVGLVAILFEGGLTTAWRGLRPVLRTASLLATVGVLVTAIVTGFAAVLLFDDLDLQTSLLLGAVVASTDAAAVFATLRFTPLRRRVARVLEAESGGNDPFAVALTIGLIGWIEGEIGPVGFGLLVVGELALGLVFGALLGLGASWALARLPASMDPFVPVASIATAAFTYGLTDVAHGSGFLAVYVVGLFVGNTRSPFRHEIVSFHQGVAFLAQVVLFVVLGLLVFPSELGPGRAPRDRAHARAAPRRAAAGRLALDARRRASPGPSSRCSAGRACAGRCRSCSPRSRSPRGSSRATRSSTRSSSSSSSRRCSRGRRSSGSRAGSALVRVAGTRLARPDRGRRGRPRAARVHGSRATSRRPGPSSASSAFRARRSSP